MALVDFSKREITIKLVYYGPALSGKTTNLQALHARLLDRHRSQLLTLDTANDRTLYFDVLPISFQSLGGPRVVIKLFTVPGQVMHNNTRRMVLRGVDGVAFIADSQRSETKANNDSFLNLHQNLHDNGLDPDSVPLVIQFNKRDLPPEQIRSDEELEALAQRGRETLVTAAALQGVGVAETFFALLCVTWDALERSVAIGTRHGVSREALISELGRRLQAPELAAQTLRELAVLLPPEEAPAAALDPDAFGAARSTSSLQVLAAGPLARSGESKP